MPKSTLVHRGQESNQHILEDLLQHLSAGTQIFVRFLQGNCRTQNLCH